MKESHKILRTWSWLCPKCCGKQERMEVQTILGARMEVITLWCACPTSELIEFISGDKRHSKSS